MDRNRRGLPVALKLSLGLLAPFMVIFGGFWFRTKVAEYRIRGFADETSSGMGTDRLEALAKAHHVKFFYTESEKIGFGYFYAWDGVGFFRWGCAVQCVKKVSISKGTIDSLD
jgi:hypothetical protein